MKNNLWKLSLIPICLVVIISGTFLLNKGFGNENILKGKTYVDEKNNITLNINEINNSSASQLKIDADIKPVTANDINIPVPFKDLVTLPSDLNKDYHYVVYTKESIDSKDYNIVYNYIIGYSNGNDRSIQVAYATDHKPIRDYRFSEEGSKTTLINGVELTIYKFENIYFTEFTYNGYNFDIETSKITEQELSDFLISVLK